MSLPQRTPACVMSFKGESIPECLRSLAALLDSDGSLCLIGLWNTDFDSEGVSIQVALDVADLA